MHLNLYFFGAPTVELGGQPIDVGRNKAVALLAYLALTGRPARRDTLATLLWPNSDQTRARTTLRITLSHLKTTLGGDSNAPYQIKPFSYCRHAYTT